MRDFLRGTMGCALQIVLFILGIVLIGASCVASLGAGNIVFLVLGILCFCAVAGIRYWLGNIFRIR